MKAATITDVARRANVHKSTVSRVLNKSDNVSEETKVRVLMLPLELFGGVFPSVIVTWNSWSILAKVAAKEPVQIQTDSSIHRAIFPFGLRKFPCAIG